MADGKPMRFWLGMIFASLFSALAAAEPLAPAALPDWVVPVQPLPDSEIAMAPAQGRHWLLYDTQVREEIDQSFIYRRRVAKAVAANAVQDLAKFEVVYDPTYEQILVHHIRLHRGGETIDALAAAHVEILRREPSLDAGLYDGRETLYIRLNDVRPGDIVDTAHTVAGRNPSEKGERFISEQRGWAVNVERQHFRFSWPEARGGHVYLSRTPMDAGLSDGYRTVTIAPEPVIAQREEAGGPSGAGRFARIVYSTYDDWGEVARNASPFFETQTLGATATALADRIAATHITFETRMQAAIRFVQDDIRYQAVTLGAGGWVPRDPETILATRYGDCKDKSLLITLFARYFGADDTAIALVHSTDTYTLPDDLPRLTRFNHAIAWFEKGDTPYWVDGTQRHQGGTLDTMTQPYFGHALRLASTTQGLTPMPLPLPQAPTSDMNLVFDLRQGGDAPAQVSVHTLARGATANTLRATLAGKGEAEIETAYRSLLEPMFGPALLQQAAHISDDRERNEISLKIVFNLPAPYDIALDETSALAEFRMRPVYRPTFFSRNARHGRTLPLDILEGLHAVISTEALLPEGAVILENAQGLSPADLDLPSVTFTRRGAQDALSARMSVTLRTLADTVPARDAEAVFRFNRRMDKALEAIVIGVPKTPVMSAESASAIVAGGE